MKVTKEENKEAFKPLTISITLQTQKEFDDFVCGLEKVHDHDEIREWCIDNGDDSEMFMTAMQQMWEAIE